MASGEGQIGRATGRSSIPQRLPASTNRDITPGKIGDDLDGPLARETSQAAQRLSESIEWQRRFT